MFILQVVREDGNIEKIIFPVPLVCKNLSDITKQRILVTTKRDEKGSKVLFYYLHSAIDGQLFNARCERVELSLQFAYQH